MRRSPKVSLGLAVFGLRLLVSLRLRLLVSLGLGLVLRFGLRLVVDLGLGLGLLVSLRLGLLVLGLWLVGLCLRLVVYFGLWLLLLGFAILGILLVYGFPQSRACTSIPDMSVQPEGFTSFFSAGLAASAACLYRNLS